MGTALQRRLPPHLCSYHMSCGNQSQWPPCFCLISSVADQIHPQLHRVIIWNGGCSFCWVGDVLWRYGSHGTCLCSSGFFQYALWHSLTSSYLIVAEHVQWSAEDADQQLVLLLFSDHEVFPSHIFLWIRQKSLKKRSNTFKSKEGCCPQQWR